MHHPPFALVVGAGVSGLTTGIRLLEAGWQVRLVAEKPPLETTSAVAAAIWLPYKAYPPERALRWGVRSFAVFTELAQEPATGVLMREGVELWRRAVADPWWRSAVPQFARCAEELPPGYADGYRFTVPLIEMPVYLTYLLERFLALGGRSEPGTLPSLAEAAARSRVVINCTGLGSRTLVPDDQLQPIRGQIVRVTNPGLTHFVLDEEFPGGPAYIVPRSRDCLLGGTIDEGRWDTAPDPTIATAILARCTTLEPRLKQAAILENRVGLRPGRPAVRLQREDLPGGAICIHNYGHGGGGVTLSWGCADEVVEMCKAAL